MPKIIKKCKVCLNHFKSWSYRNQKYCSKKCYDKVRYTYKHTDEIKNRISLSTKGNKNCLGNKQSEETIKKRVSHFKGKNHWNWQNGKTKLQIKIRNSLIYKKWVNEVFERDNWTCQNCKKRGSYLEAHHHFKDFSILLKENDIKNFKESLNCKELWDINKGITLCFDCHNLTKINFYGNQYRKIHKL